MATTFSFNKTNRIITVGGDPLPTAVTIQQLINAIRDWEDELVNFDIARIADASGKEDLGGGAAVGITLKLLNWKVKFEDRGSPTVCAISGGNLVAVDSNGDTMYAIEPATNVTVILAQSTSPSLVAEWTQAEKDGQIAIAQAIKGKTDNLPLSPADQILLDALVAGLKAPAGESYDQEADSLKSIGERLNGILTKLGVTAKGGFSI